MWRSIGRLFIFCVLITLFFSGSTDADLYVNKSVPSNVWAATTLDFSNNDTTNNQETHSLFNISGMLPGGFQVKSVRIKNQGKMKFSYWITSNYQSGDKVLFDNLKIRLMKNWLVIYEGLLNSVNLEIANQVVDGEDWIVVLSLDNKDESVLLKEVNFDLVVKSNNVEKKGFYVEQRLVNNVTTGLWKNEN